jgi:hypothetical protein
MTAPEPQPAPEPATGTEPPQAPPAEPTPAETVDWKARAREWEARSKANAEAAKELQKIKDGELTELQRAQREATDAANELAAMRRENALLTKGVPANLLPPRDASPDQLSSWADDLLAWRGAAAAAPAAPAQPRPDASQGARPLEPSAAADAEWAQYQTHLFPQHRK